MFFLLVVRKRGKVAGRGRNLQKNILFFLRTVRGKSVALRSRLAGAEKQAPKPSEGDFQRLGSNRLFASKIGEGREEQPSPTAGPLIS